MVRLVLAGVPAATGVRAGGAPPRLPCPARRPSVRQTVRNARARRSSPPRSQQAPSDAGAQGDRGEAGRAPRARAARVRAAHAAPSGPPCLAHAPGRRPPGLVSSSIERVGRETRAYREKLVQPHRRSAPAASRVWRCWATRFEDRAAGGALLARSSRCSRDRAASGFDRPGGCRAAQGKAQTLGAVHGALAASSEARRPRRREAPAHDFQAASARPPAAEVGGRPVSSPPRTAPTPVAGGATALPLPPAESLFRSSGCWCSPHWRRRGSCAGSTAPGLRAAGAVPLRARTPWLAATRSQSGTSS